MLLTVDHSLLMELIIIRNFPLFEIYLLLKKIINLSLILVLKILYLIFILNFASDIINIILDSK